MRTALGKLRVAVVVVALLLVVGVAGFVVYGRRMMHRFASTLPKRLAQQLLQESFNITFSHSEHGKTVFTVHAAKEQKWTSGLITLEDVGIELYGRQDGAADRIYGKQFEFDQAKGQLTAIGDVSIDMAAPTSKDGKTDAGKTLHIKTSGLIFDQKARTATTAAGIEFQAAGMTGTAVGADYDSVRQFIVLQREVRVSGIRNDRPVLLTAAHAEIDRKAGVLDLRQPKYVSPGESLAADSARVLLTGSGEAREIQAQGHVALSSPERGMLTGDRLQAALRAGGKPQDARMWGNVDYVDRADAKDVRGHAEDLRVAFDAAGVPTHAVMTGGVQMESRTRTAGRSLHAGSVDLMLADAGKGRVAVRQATATGDAVLRMAGAGVKGRSSTEVRADLLKADFTGAGASARVTRLDGTGHTVVDQAGVDGTEDRSTGDVLEAEFAGAGKETQITHAVQRGGFHSIRTIPAKVVAGKATVPPAIQRGQAAQAVYEGTTERLVMSGAVQITDAGDVLQADAVTLDRTSGDAEAVGSVRVSYAQAFDGKPEKSPAEPVHLLAARAVENKARGTADFFGAEGRDARMWQGSSQVSAPVLSFDRLKKTMVAHGTGTGDADAVRTLLVDTAPPKPGAKEPSGPVRVLSHTMTYADATRAVVFSGQVRVDDQDGTLSAREATAYLAPEGASSVKSAAGNVFPAGQVDRIVARGDVRVTQTERRAQGDVLVYTAADRTFLLTGTPAVRPTMTDDAQGTITGKVLRFRSGDESVQVTGDEGKDGRVQSDLKVKQR